jgi:hypothetical protein
MTIPTIPPPRRDSRTREWIAFGIVAVAFGAVIAFAMCNAHESRPELAPSSADAPPDAAR